MTPSAAQPQPQPVHRQAWWRPGGVPVLELAVVGALLALVVPWGRLSLPWRADEPSPPVAYAVLTENFRNGPAEIVAFDEVTGDVLGRLPTDGDMQFVADAAGERVYVLSTTWEDPQQGETVLTTYETQGWSMTAQVTLDVAPRSLALSPDGEHLVLLFSDYMEDIWLQRRDAQSLQPVADAPQGDLPDYCGGWRVWTTTTHLLVLCSGGQGSASPVPTTLYAIDPTNLQVVASLPLVGADTMNYGLVSDIIVSADRSSVYVIYGDLQILEVDGSTLAVRRNLRDHTRTTQTIERVAITSEMLLVSARDTVGPVAFVQLRRFSLPALAELPPISLPEESRFAPASDAAFYVWSWEAPLLTRWHPQTDERQEYLLGEDSQHITSVEGVVVSD